MVLISSLLDSNIAAEGRYMLPAMTTRDDYVHFVEVLYFGAIRSGHHDKVLEYFAPGASLTGYSGDQPPRLMTRQPGPGETSLDAFMQAAAAFDLVYGDFVHFVDIEAARVASHFTLHMQPKAAGTAHGLPSRRLRNCNFFQFDANRLVSVVAYFSNPGNASS